MILRMVLRPRGPESALPR